MNTICKFNTYCGELKVLYDPSWLIPLPCPLSTKLAELHADQSLMEDVWIKPADDQVPLWLEDQNICQGICSLLK